MYSGTLSSLGPEARRPHLRASRLGLARSVWAAPLEDLTGEFSDEDWSAAQRVHGLAGQSRARVPFREIVRPGYIACEWLELFVQWFALARMVGRYHDAALLPSLYLLVWLADVRDQHRSSLIEQSVRHVVVLA